MRKRRIVILSEGPVQNGWAGPSLRVRQLAVALCETHDITVYGSKNLFENIDTVTSVSKEECTLMELLRTHDIVISRPGLLGARHFFYSRRNGTRIISDLFCPQSVEGLAYYSKSGPSGPKLYSVSQRRLRRALRFSDYFLCSSPNQKLFCLGAITALRNLSLGMQKVDPFLKSLIGVVPYGVDRYSPVPQLTREKTIPSVEKDDAPIKYTLLWGGGLWPWTDPETFLRGCSNISQEVKERVEIHFPGIGHPDKTVAPSSAIENVHSIVESDPFLQNSVLFSGNWMNEDDYVATLGLHTIGISIDRGGIESTLSWRFRIIAYICGAIPVILTSGCPLSEMIQQEGGGIIVAPGDHKAFARAVERLVSDRTFYEQCSHSLLRIRDSLDFKNIGGELLQYCNSPLEAEDLKDFSVISACRLLFP